MENNELITSSDEYSLETSELQEETSNLSNSNTILTIYDKFITTSNIDDDDRKNVENILINTHGIDQSQINKLSNNGLFENIKILYPHLLMKSSIHEIYGTDEDRMKHGWIINHPITTYTYYTNSLIALIKTYFYDYYKIDFRKFTPNKAIYIIRWLGYSCKNFLNNIMVGNTAELNDPIYLGRWRFLHMFWNSKHMSFFMSFKNSNEIIEKDHTKYLIRLSTTHSGQLALHFWCPKHKKVTAVRLEINKYGCIMFPYTLGFVSLPNLCTFDEYLRKFYLSKYHINLPPINDESTYNDIVTGYSSGY